MKKHILTSLFLAACLALPCVVARAQVTCAKTHTVKKKETIYSITHLYGIGEQDFIQANPILKTEPLKAGSVVCIPQTAGGALPPAEAAAHAQPSQAVSQKQDIVKVAVFLPFQSDNLSPTSNQTYMVEYYQGFLMAIHQLKTEGVSVNLCVYDSGSTPESLRQILADNKSLANMDLIFGPGYADQVSVLAEYTRNTAARMIVPFSSKDDCLATHPFLYQVNTPKAQLYDIVCRRMVDTFPEARFVFMHPDEVTHDKADFVEYVQNYFTRHHIGYTTLSGNDLLAENVMKHLDQAAHNVLIPDAGSNAALFKLLPQLVVAHRDHAEVKLSLFGYPEWQKYLDDHLANFYELDTYFYTSFFANQMSSETAAFARKFHRWFNRDLANSYPQYAMLGYDTAYYFIRGFHLFGCELEENLNDFSVGTIQTGFHFERVAASGGFGNQKVFFVHFTPDYHLNKIDFD